MAHNRTVTSIFSHPNFIVLLIFSSQIIMLDNLQNQFTPFLLYENNFREINRNRLIIRRVVCKIKKLFQPSGYYGKKHTQIQDLFTYISTCFNRQMLLFCFQPDMWLLCSNNNFVCYVAIFQQKKDIFNNFYNVIRTLLRQYKFFKFKNLIVFY